MRTALKLRDLRHVYGVGDYESRPSDRVRAVVYHRSGSSLGETPEELAATYQDTRTKYSAGSYTGKKFPYHFYIWKDGVVDQCVNIIKKAPHAAVANVWSIGVGCRGDFRDSAPTVDQLEACLLLGVELSRWMRSVSVFGHDEIEGASQDVSKSCPGRFFPTRWLKRAVAENINDWPSVGNEASSLKNTGIVVGDNEENV